MFIRDDNVIPSPILLNPDIGVDTLNVNDREDTIAITASLTVSKIAGTRVLTESVNSVDLARVIPKPSADSGPTNPQVVPFQMYNTPIGVLYQKDPSAGLVGAMFDAVAEPILSHRSPL